MLDVLVLVIVVLFGVFGLLSGLLLQVLRLAATVAAVLVAVRFSGPVMAAWPGTLASHPGVREFLFPAVLFCGTYLVLALMARLVVKVVHGTGPTVSATDRILGGLAGVLKGAVLSYFLVSLLLSVQAEVGRPMPGLDADRSWAASLVRNYSLGRVRDWSGWPRWQRLFQEETTPPGAPSSDPEAPRGDSGSP